MTTTSDDGEFYPDAWKHPATRKRELEAQRDALERQRFIDQMADSRAIVPGTAATTSGCGGHLGPSRLATSDDYPREWLSNRADIEKNN